MVRLLSTLLAAAPLFAAAQLQCNSTLISDSELTQLNAEPAQSYGKTFVSTSSLFDGQEGCLTETIPAADSPYPCAFAQFFVTNYTVPANETYDGAYVLQAQLLRSKTELKYVIAHVASGNNCSVAGGTSNKMLAFNGTLFPDYSQTYDNVLFFENGTMQFTFPYSEIGNNGTICWDITYQDWNATQCDTNELFFNNQFVPEAAIIPSNDTGVWRSYHGLFNNSLGYLTPATNETAQCQFAQFFIVNYTVPAGQEFSEGAFILAAQIVNATQNVSYVIAHVGGGEGCYSAAGVDNKQVWTNSTYNTSDATGIATDGPVASSYYVNGTFHFVFPNSELVNGTSCFALTYSNPDGVQCDSSALFQNGAFNFYAPGTGPNQPTGIQGTDSPATSAPAPGYDMTNGNNGNANGNTDNTGNNTPNSGTSTGYNPTNRKRYQPFQRLVNLMQ